MDTLTFISNMVSSLIWPVVVVFIVVILRRPLRELIADLGRRLRSIKFPGGEAEFSDELAEIKEAADEANLPPAPITPLAGPLLLEVEGDERQWVRLAELSPRAAVTEAWRQVEIAMREVARRFEIPERESRSPLTLIRALGKRQILTPDILAIVGDLRGVRNTAAHGLGVEITQTDAAEYVALAKRVITKLRT